MSLEILRQLRQKNEMKYGDLKLRSTLKMGFLCPQTTYKFQNIFKNKYFNIL